jgi:hypothetical protein
MNMRPGGRRGIGAVCAGFIVVAGATIACAESAGSLYREGVFEHSATKMTTCLMTLMHLIREDVYLFEGMAGDWRTVAGAPKNDVEAATWVVAALDQGGRSAQIKLIGRGAPEGDLSEAWEVLETCKKQH